MKKFFTFFALLSVLVPSFSFAATDYNASPFKNAYKSDDACWRGVVHIVAVAPYLAHEQGVNQVQIKYAQETGQTYSDGVPKVVEKADVIQGANLYHYWVAAVQPKKDASADCTKSLPLNDNSNSGAGTTVTDNSSGGAIDTTDLNNGTANATSANNANTDYNPGPSGLVSDCNRGALVQKNVNGMVIEDFANPCNFNNITDTINKVINFLLFVIATPMVAIGLCYAGFLYLTSGGSSESVNQAKSIIKNMIMGYIVALIAWVLIKTIMVSLGVGDAASLFLDIKK